LGKTLKKFIIIALIVVLLPLIVSLVSYKLESNKNNVFVSSNTIELAKMESKTYADLAYVSNRILSSNFLNEVIENNNMNIEVNDLKSSTSVEIEPAGQIKINVTRTVKNESEDILNKITNQILEESKTQYDALYDLNKGTITRLSAKKSEAQDFYEVERLLYDLEFKNLNMQEARISEFPKTEIKSFSPISKAITSGLLAFSILLLLLIGYGIFKVNKKQIIPKK